MFRQVCVLMVVLAAPSAAQGVGSVTLVLDNDILAPRGGGAPADHDYTHGLSLTLELLRDSAACVAKPCARKRIGLGQRIYTPRRDAPTPIAGERPYAAWLYAAAGVTRETAGRRRTLAVEVGVTGPPALGEPVQNGVHRLAGSRRQEGWSHQLGFEPGILARLEDSIWMGRAAPVLRTVRLAPTARVVLGNVRTAGAAGVSVEAGGAAGLYARLGGEGEWVVRDLFLDGNSFRGNSTARKLPGVARGEAGVGFRGRGRAGEYRVVARSREYRAQPGAHVHGSLVFTWAR
ncbi:MAG TPA: lipid A deacylase LpxR family protein [Longimicrobium sp.]|nr:lipid A deacylase LpxR family protein [Longimicrobium sp.]